MSAVQKSFIMHNVVKLVLNCAMFGKMLAGDHSVLPTLYAKGLLQVRSGKGCSETTPLNAAFKRRESLFEAASR